MMLFPNALFLATTFPKIVKNSIFLMKFYQNFSKISQIFPTICVFPPKARKINAWFVKFFENYVIAIFLRNFLKIFENSPASGGSAPLTTHEADPLKSSPRNRNPGGVADITTDKQKCPCFIHFSCEIHSSPYLKLNFKPRIKLAKHKHCSIDRDH